MYKGHGKRGSYGKDTGMAWQPPASVKSSGMFVKQEMGASRAKVGETDREAKIRARMERIRAEAEGRAAPEVVNMPSQAARPQAPAPAPAQGVKRKNPAADDPKREEADAAKLERMLPPLEEKVSAVEEEAERVGIVAAPLAMDPTPEMKDLQLTAVKETERAVKAAQRALVMARRELDKKKTEASGFAPMASESALEEIGKLAVRIEAAQAQLDEHKNARRDHEMAKAAQQLFGELSARITSIEIDCEKTSSMAEPLARVLDTSPEGISHAEIRETKEALRVAQSTLAPTLRIIAGKLSGLKGAVRSKMMDLQARAETSQSILDKASATIEEAQSRAAAGPNLKQAADRMLKVEDVLQLMRETEAPFLMGIEAMPGEEGSKLIEKMDKAAALAQSAVVDAHKYVSLKMMEMGKLGESAAKATNAELSKMKAKLDEHLEKIRQFQADAVTRKRSNVVEVVRHRVEQAEESMQKLKEIEEKLKEVAMDDFNECLEEAHALELEAQKAVTAARREMQDRQQELRPIDGGNADVLKSGSEALRTKVRVNFMETELAKYKKLARELEEKAKVSKSMASMAWNLGEADAEADRLLDVSQLWSIENKPSEADEAGMTALQSKMAAATLQVEKKLQSAQGVGLRELKAHFGKLKATQSKLDKVKAAARKLKKESASLVIGELTKKVQSAEGSVGELCNAASSPAKLSLEKLQEVHQDTSTILSKVARINDELADLQSSGDLIMESKVEFARLQLRCKALLRRAKAAAETLSGQYDRITSAATEDLLQVLRSAAQGEDGAFDVDLLLKQLGGTNEVTEAMVTDYVLRAHPELSEERAKFAMHRLAPSGISREGMQGLLACFMKVVREVSITDSFTTACAKRVRMLELGEVVELLGEVSKDESGLARARCRAIGDGGSGWVSVEGGPTTYLEKCAKPFLFCAIEVQLTDGMDESSALVRNLRPGEVLGIVEGPREQRTGSDTRVRGTACEEGSSGWLQVTGANGEVLAKLSPDIRKCTEAIAMTDLADFDNCTMIRRIDAGEALVELSDPGVQPSEGGMRRKFRACRDGSEGWVTVTGSQATEYVRPASKHYVCLQAAPVHAGLGAESAVVRVLMPGEAFSAFEEPKDVSGGGARSQYRVRVSTDGSEGFVTATEAQEVMPWSGHYKVLRTVPLTKGLSANEAAEAIEVVRVLEQDDVVIASEPPVEDRSTGYLRVRCHFGKDKGFGWATVREGSSTTSPLLMEPTAEPAKTAGVARGEATRAAPSTPPAVGKSSSKGSKRKAEAKSDVSKWQKGGAKGKGKNGK